MTRQIREMKWLVFDQTSSLRKTLGWMEERRVGTCSCRWQESQDSLFWQKLYFVGKQGTVAWGESLCSPSIQELHTTAEWFDGDLEPLILQTVSIPDISSDSSESPKFFCIRQPEQSHCNNLLPKRQLVPLTKDICPSYLSLTLT